MSSPSPNKAPRPAPSGTGLYVSPFSVPSTTSTISVSQSYPTGLSAFPEHHVPPVSQPFQGNGRYNGPLLAGSPSPPHPHSREFNYNFPYAPHAHPKPLGRRAGSENVAFLGTDSNHAHGSTIHREAVAIHRTNPYRRQNYGSSIWTPPNLSTPTEKELQLGLSSPHGTAAPVMGNLSPYNYPSIQLRQDRRPYSGMPAPQSNSIAVAPWLAPPPPCGNVTGMSSQSHLPFQSPWKANGSCYPDITSAHTPGMPFNTVQHLPCNPEQHQRIPSSFVVPTGHPSRARISHVQAVRETAHTHAMVYRPTLSANQANSPLSGKSSLQEQEQMYRPFACHAPGTSAAHGFERLQPFINCQNQFTIAPSYGSSGTRDSFLPAVLRVNSGTSENRVLDPHNQHPVPVQDSKEGPMGRARGTHSLQTVNRAICMHCDKVFKTDKDMLRHVQRMHVNKGRYPCTYGPCKQSFSEAHKLTRHVRTVHLMSRPFKCPLCCSAFGERGNMVQHLRKIHLGEGREAKRVKRS